MTLLSDILTGRMFKLKTAGGSDVNAGTSDKMILTPKSIGSSAICMRDAGTGQADDPVVVGSGNKLMKSEARQTAFNKNFGTTPGSVMEGNEISSVMQFLIRQEVTAGGTSWVIGEDYDIIPDNAYNYTGRASTYKGKLYAYIKADSGVTGEVAVYDVLAGAIVTGSNFTFTAPGYTVLSSAEFNLTPGKVYTYAIRRVSGGVLTNARIRAGMMTIKLPKA